jgi:hypothetical protein
LNFGAPFFSSLSISATEARKIRAAPH